MNIFYIIYIAAGLVIFELVQDLIKRFLNKKKAIFLQEGANWVLNHIYKQVKEKGGNANRYSDLRDSIGRSGIEVTKGAFQSDNFITGSTGWQLKADGDFEGS